MTKILHIINSSGLGGAETMVKDILLENTTDKVFCLKKDSKDRFSILQNRVTYGTTGSWYKLNLLIFLRLKRMILLEDIKILHVHLAYSLFYSILVKLFMPSLILIYHEHSEIFYNKKFKYFLNFFQDKINLIISVSLYLKKELIRNGISEQKIMVLHNFVDTEKYLQKVKKIEFNIPKNINSEKKFTLGFGARLIKRKGWKDLLLAFCVLVKENPEYRLLIAGDGPDKKKLIEFIIDNNIKDKVIYLGYLNDMRTLYETCDLFILPSHYEGLPMSQLESMCYGVPLLSSNGNGLNEVADEGQITYFKNRDIKDLCLKIKFCKSNYDSILKKAKLAQTLSVNFSLQSYIIKLNSIYKHVKI